MTIHAQTHRTISGQVAGSRRKIPLLSTLLTLHAVWSERRRLARLEQHRLDDIGLSLEDAKDEARRQMWDAPERWRR